ncbi:MAG: hypothetical protein KKA64_02605 [Nanoarchaeota archaeon]|nr:hypothetical protein [Nanoarchaeota archaeon]
MSYKDVDKRKTLNTLYAIDNYLGEEGYTKRFPIYFIGGSALILSEFQKSSKDIDFITDNNGYLALEGFIDELEKQKGIKIDMFKKGFLPNYRCEDCLLRSKKFLGLKHLEVYILDYIDIILTKGIAGREDDIEAIKSLKDRGIIATKEELIKRFNGVVPNRGKEEEINRRFKTFVKRYESL